MSEITSHTVIKALRSRHSECVFVEECKDGPTWIKSHSRLDAWVMEKSWRNPRVIGYEVKVSRSDFLNDNKHRAYLGLCNELYFAAPKGLIAAAELPPEIGLVELLGQSRFKTTKKAPFRDVTIPESLFRYILMCRAKIGGEIDFERPMENKRDNAQRWREWLNQKAENFQLGHDCAYRIAEEVRKVDRENSELRRKIEQYDHLVKWLQSIGVNTGQSWNLQHAAQMKIENLRQVFPEDVCQKLSSTHRVLGEMIEQVSKLGVVA